MKLLVVVLMVFVLPYSTLFAQNGKTVRVKAGEDMAQAYSPQGFYRFPEFIKAVVYFKGGGRNGGPLFNYNVLSATMQFIGPKGDTLDMGNTDGLDSIVFPNTVFLYREGFLEAVAGNDSLRLLKKLILKTQVENIGAYGLANNTASITSIKSFSSGNGVYNLIVNVNVVLDENITWYFAGGTNIVKANKGNLLKLLPNDKSSRTEAYLKENKVNFEREADLRRLMIVIAEKREI